MKRSNTSGTQKIANSNTLVLSALQSTSYCTTVTQQHLTSERDV